MPRKCFGCNSRASMSRFERESFEVEYAGDKVRVEGLSGWRCDSCDEIEFDASSARRYAAAGDKLVLEHRAKQSKEIRRIRRKLGLTQGDAARLTGGGHNAFSRYERGEAAPMPAVVNLFRLLDKHPNLLKDLTTGTRLHQRTRGRKGARQTRRRAASTPRLQKQITQRFPG